MSSAHESQMRAGAEGITRTCKFPGCASPATRAKIGYCPKHYGRWYRHGNPALSKKRPLPAVCEIGDCRRPARSRRGDSPAMCNMHVARWDLGWRGKELEAPKFTQRRYACADGMPQRTAAQGGGEKLGGRDGLDSDVRAEDMRANAAVLTPNWAPPVMTPPARRPISPTTTASRGAC